MALDRQLTYDMVRDHLMNQGAESYSADGYSCAYRGTGGRMCALGVLMPDEIYSPGFEGKGIIFLPKEIQAALGCETQEDIDFLWDLQKIHDTRDPDYWAESLYDFATERELRP